MIKMHEEEIEKIIETTINKSNKEYISLKEQFEELRNDYIELARSEEQLQNNWNELKKGLQSLFEFDYGVVSKDYLECAEDTLEKMQELEGNNE